MAEPAGVEARLTSLESRVEEVAADAAAARHLAAAHDRDLADLGVKVDANRRAINGLGIRTAARFDRLESRFDRFEARFDRFEGEVRAGFAQTTAGMEQIVGLLDTLIARSDDS